MTMSSSSGKESVDSMQDVTDLVVRVNESSIGGVELYVRVPVYQDSGELSQPEQPTTEELMVGYIRDVDDIRYMKSQHCRRETGTICGMKWFWPILFPPNMLRCWECRWSRIFSLTATSCGTVLRHVL